MPPNQQQMRLVFRFRPEFQMIMFPRTEKLSRFIPYAAPHAAEGKRLPVYVCVWHWIHMLPKRLSVYL